MKYSYYYNDVPNKGKVRNNLVYTSLISEDQKVFVKWFHNDSEYHLGMNQVVDQDLMDLKWQRELMNLQLMRGSYPDHVPQILDIDYKNKKIYLEIDGVDFWQRHYDRTCSYHDVLPDWEQQMIEIIEAHKTIGLWKYSMHPSSYFIVEGKLKSINYFFSYRNSEPLVSVEEHRSHISIERQQKLEAVLEKMGLDWKSKVPFKDLQILCFESFKSDYPESFIEKVKGLYAV